MKLSNRQLQNLYIGLKNIDADEKTSLGEIRMPLAINFTRIEPFVRQFEAGLSRARVDLLKDADKPGFNASSIENILGMMFDEEVEVELKTLKLSDFKLGENKSIKVSTLAFCAPIIEDWDT